MTECSYHIKKCQGESDHGCYAVVGDLVELLNGYGERTGIHGLVQSVEEVSAIVPKRYLWVYGQSDRIKDSYVRITSRCIGA